MTVEDIITQVKRLAAEYYRQTDKPLGVTGEVGEYEVARLLGLKLTEARKAGHDAIDSEGHRYQIKARSLDEQARRKSQMTGTLNNKEWDAALVAIMDREFTVLEIWQANRVDVDRELERPGSKGRNERRQMSLSKFKQIGHKRYP